MDCNDRLQTIVAYFPKRAGRSARPFFARAEDVETSPGVWGKQTVRVFENGIEVGIYDRNYPDFGETTFEPFEVDGKWFALYSSDYTCTRIMTLPRCEDIGGEEPASVGFCPVEFYVPRYRHFKLTDRVTGRVMEKWQFESKAEEDDEGLKKYFDVSVSSWKSLNVGFISGCIWGDDSSWKLETLDLSRAQEGIIERTARFGHFEIAAGFPLVAAVQLHRDWPNPLRAKLFRQESRDLATGKRVDPYTDELID